MTIRIGHCIHGLGLGGAQEVIKTLVAATAGLGFEHVVYSCEGGLFQERIEAAGGTVRIVPRHIPKLDPFWVSRLANAMRSDGVDLVHTHLFGDSLHGWLAARRAGRPNLMTLHLPFRNVPKLQRRSYVWLLHRATRVVACSEEAGRSFSEAAHHEISIQTVPNGVDDIAATTTKPEARSRLGLPADALVIATIGRLAAEKGVIALLDAVAGIDTLGAPVHLAVVGEGEERAALAAHAQQLGIADRVRFTGARSDVREILPAFDVVASSSLGEGLPLSLLESMCASRALVWTDVDGMSATVRPDEEALLVPSGDVPAFRDALQRVLTDDALRARLGAAARARFVQDFTSARMIDRYREIYELMYRAAGEAPRRQEAA